MSKKQSYEAINQGTKKKHLIHQVTFEHLKLCTHILSSL